MYSFVLFKLKYIKKYIDFVAKTWYNKNIEFVL